MSIFPPKLKPGDTIRIISPSFNLQVVSKKVQCAAIRNLRQLGLSVTFPKLRNVNKENSSKNLKYKLQDIYDAFEDKNIHGVLTSIGGNSAIELVPQIDYKLIRKNPKIICGYSDATSVLNAIFARTGLITYYGPHFSTFGQRYNKQYMLDMFKACCMDTKPFELYSSTYWHDYPWWKDLRIKKLIHNDGCCVLSKGNAQGILVGGNIASLTQLIKVEYFPINRKLLLFLEASEDYTLVRLKSDLKYLIGAIKTENIRGVLFGRFPKQTRISKNDLAVLLRSLFCPDQIPIVCNLNFGHTYPLCTIPIGGNAVVQCTDKNRSISIFDH